MGSLSEPLALVGWRILSAVDLIIPGKQAKTRAQNWESPYSPEMVMLEMMAQTAGLVVGSVRGFSGNVVFAKVESADFSCHEPRATSDELSIEALAPDGVGEQGSWIEAQIFSGTDKIASSKLFLIDAGDLNGTGRSLTFHEEFLRYYQVRQKIKSHEPRATNHE